MKLGKKQVNRPISIVAIVVLLGTVATAQTNHAVDISAFQGVWHEVARTPNLFQRSCAATTAEYRLQQDGSIQVINRCQTCNGGCKTITGTARATNACNNQLSIAFPVPFGGLAARRGRANYLIHYVSPDYQRAVVGTPRGRLVWILSRSPNLSNAELQSLTAIARRAGYRTDNLIVP